MDAQEMKEKQDKSDEKSDEKPLVEQDKWSKEVNAKDQEEKPDEGNKINGDQEGSAENKLVQLNNQEGNPDECGKDAYDENESGDNQMKKPAEQESEKADEEKELADNNVEHPAKQEGQDDDEQANDKEDKLQTELEEILKEQMIQDNCTDMHESENEEEDKEKKGGNVASEQARDEEHQNKSEKQILKARNYPARDQSEEIEKPQEIVAQDDFQSKEQQLEVKVIHDGGKQLQGEGQELLEIAQQPNCHVQQLRKAAEQQLLEEVKLRKEVEQKLEEGELKRQALEEQVRVQEQALQNAEAAFKVALKRKDALVKEVTAELESFMETKNEDEKKLRSQLKSATDENQNLILQLQKMQKNTLELETFKSIRGGGGRILTVKRRIDHVVGVEEEGKDVNKGESSNKKREASTNNQEAVVKIKKMKVHIGSFDENENLDISREVEDDEDVVEVDGTWGQHEEDQPRKVEKTNIVMCKKCKDVLPTRASLKLHNCGNMSSVTLSTSSRRK